MLVTIAFFAGLWLGVVCGVMVMALVDNKGYWED